MNSAMPLASGKLKVIFSINVASLRDDLCGDFRFKKLKTALPDQLFWLKQTARDSMQQRTINHGQGRLLVGASLVPFQLIRPNIIAELACWNEHCASTFLSFNSWRGTSVAKI